MKNLPDVILNHQQIHDILHRIAYQIWEELYGSPSVALVGVSERACRLSSHLYRIWQRFEGAPPLRVFSYDTIKSDMALALNGHRHMVLFDDVINTGATMFEVMGRVALLRPERVVITVLVNRDHLLFPVHPEIVGHTLSTTYQEHIYVKLDKDNYHAVLA